MEIRKDYLLNRWIIVSEARGKRPHELTAAKQITNAFCAFCPGNESQTPPAIYQTEKDGKWNARVIPNKFPAVDSSALPTLQTHNTFYTFGSDRGEHEIIIETPKHNVDFGELSQEEIQEIIRIYASRTAQLKKNPLNKYVCLFKNQGHEAGASLRHPHSQIITLPTIPPEIIEELEATKKYPSCPYCDIINREKGSDRRCFENDSFVAFTPYASRFNYEIWAFPKKHINGFEEFDDKAYADLANIIKSISQKLEKMGAAYDVAWHYSPQGENLHFHIEFMPRIALWAGFELGFGIDINAISPETAAKYYRGEE
jgi:UDPglucose--hexose-1-phosphate uridylyltransferase